MAALGNAPASLGPAVVGLMAGDAPDLGSYLGSWLAHVRGRVRARTYQGYECLIRLYVMPHLSEVPLAELHPLALQELYAWLMQGKVPPISAGSVVNLHLVLIQSLNQAVRWGMLSSNPAKGAQPPRPRRPELAVVDADLAGQILSKITGTPVEIPAAIAIATGMRRGEILGLRWGDLDAGVTIAQVRRSLQVTPAGLIFEEPKTRRSRRAVALPSFLRPYLVRQREDQDLRRESLSGRWSEHDLLIDGGDGSPLHPDTLSSAWRRFLLGSGLPHVRFHDLRHAHASLMLLQGVHPKVVSERLGHASVGITLDTYSHVLPGMQAEAAAAFDELFS